MKTVRTQHPILSLVVIGLLVTACAGGDDSTPANGAGDGWPRTFEGAELTRSDCALRFNDFRTPVDPQFADADGFMDADSYLLIPSASETDSVVPFRGLVECLEPNEMVIAVEGLPGVSGLYRSRDLDMRSRGFAGAGDPAVAGTQCFVAAEGIPFQSNTVISVLGEDSDHFANVVSAGTVGFSDTATTGDRPGWSKLTRTIDVGISQGQGSPDGPQPFVGINDHAIFPGDEAEIIDAGLVTRNYVAALPRENAVITVSPPNWLPTDENPFAGYVTFTSTFYDNTKFFNFITEDGPNLPEWDGDPLYHGKISVWCGG